VLISIQSLLALQVYLYLLRWVARDRITAVCTLAVTLGTGLTNSNSSLYEQRVFSSSTSPNHLDLAAIIPMIRR
jgi:hypothetical protein